jgi:hypothetical protein
VLDMENTLTPSPYIHPAAMTAEQRAATSAAAHHSLARAFESVGRTDEASRARARGDRIAAAHARSL